MLEFFKGTVTPQDLGYAGAIVSVAALIFVGFYFALYRPQLTEIESAQAGLDKLNAELRLMRNLEKVAEEKNLKAKSELMNKYVAQFEQRLPDEAEIQQLLANFDKLAPEIGLNYYPVSLQRRIDQSKVTIPYRVTCIGNFHEIGLFINEIESDDRYLKVSNLRVGEQEAGVSTATFTLSTYKFIKQDEPKAEAAS